MASPAETFLPRAVEALRGDARIRAVLVGGAHARGEADDWSDLDLVAVIDDAAEAAVMADRPRIVASLAPRLLASFMGEHVGEPRLVVSLFGDPLVHVDVLFTTLARLAERRDPVRLVWAHDAAVEAFLQAHRPQPHALDRQWLEDRFWTWVHNVALKIGRGELFEAQDGIAYIRLNVLGPMILAQRGRAPYGVRRVETAAPDLVPALEATIGVRSRAPLIAALRATVALYRALRAADAVATPRLDAEHAVMAFIDAVAAR